MIKCNPCSSRIKITLSSKRWRKCKEEAEHCKLQRKTTRAHIVIRRIIHHRMFWPITLLPGKITFRIIQRLLCKRKKKMRNSPFNYKLKVRLQRRISPSNSKNNQAVFWQMFNKILHLNRRKNYSITNRKSCNNKINRLKLQIRVQTSMASKWNSETWLT